MKEKTLHMIGNAHIDPVWLWRWQEGFHEVLSSFRSALDRMNEDDDFTFVSSSAAFYEWVEQNQPAMFTEIQQRVADGRWEIVGGWWIQPDCNIPSGESFVRQGLYGQRYFQEKFGVTAKVGYNVDSFGHNSTLPQILKKSGMDYYVFMRPSPQEKGLPSRLFWWESDDGSRVLAFRLAFTYHTSAYEIERIVQHTAQEIKAPLSEMMVFYGVGNHGGGPTKANIARIHQLQKEPTIPKLLFSSCNRFFAAVAPQADNFPVVHDELQRHASGCYAAHSGIKQWNRQAENLLLTAETWSTIAAQTVSATYTADFSRAWKNVLFNQFHDILAGTSIESAYEDARDMHGEAMSIGARALNQALQAVAWQINIPQEDEMLPIVVFNPHAWESQVYVELEMGELPQPMVLLDDLGKEIPWQLVQSEATVDKRQRLSFIANLPALGYRVYRVMPCATPQPVTSEIMASDTVLDNGRLRLEFDSETGCITRLYDHEAGLELLAGPGARPVVIADNSDTWAHDVFAFNDEVGVFKASSVTLVAHGSVKSVIRVVSDYGRSQLIQDFTMNPGSRLITVKTRVNWQEQFKMLKLRFPVHMEMHKVTHETAYGHIERFANGEEEPIQRWIDVSGISLDHQHAYGLSILNDAKYSADVNNRDIGLTVLRSPIYAHHDPIEPAEAALYSFTDQGIQQFTYGIYPHEGSWEGARTVQRAAELNQPPLAFIATYHPQGTLPQANSFAAVDNDNVILAVLKQAEDGSDLILRAYETTRTATTATISLPQWGWEVTAVFNPCEIKTFRIPHDKRKKVEEVDLLERPL